MYHIWKFNSKPFRIPETCWPETNITFILIFRAKNKTSESEDEEYKWFQFLEQTYGES